MGNPYSKDIENSATIGPAMITLWFLGFCDGYAGHVRPAHSSPGERTLMQGSLFPLAPVQVRLPKT